MEIRQVQSFVHVARLGSFSRAAETMGYSQSAITVQIRLLEEELGTKLFDRMGKKVSLTPQGKRFLEHANRILYEMNRTIMTMNEDRELENPLHIGTIESLCTAKFPRILSQFHTLYPKVNIQITLDSPEKLIRMMEHNELDLIYILDTPRWNKEWIKVMEAAEPIVFVASVNSEFALRKEMVLQDILGEPFFLTEKMRTTGRRWISILRLGTARWILSLRSAIRNLSLRWWSEMTDFRSFHILQWRNISAAAGLPCLT